MSYFKSLKSAAAHDKDSYIDLLSLLFTVFKLARTKGWLSLEQHIEEPEDSELFAQFPKVVGNHHALIFICDYLRIISLGNDSPHEIEALMDEEIETITHHEEHPGHAVQTMADGLPALGMLRRCLALLKQWPRLTNHPKFWVK